MSNPLLMHIYFKSKVAELLERYKTESVANDQVYGYMRDLEWSKRKREVMIPELLKAFTKPELEAANSVDAYKQAFQTVLQNFVIFCDDQRADYNLKNNKKAGRGDLEGAYVERLTNMIVHLTALYKIYNVGTTQQSHIVGQGDMIAYQRNEQVQQLFSTLYNKEKMGLEDYQNIDALVKYLEQVQKDFELIFEQSIAQMRSAQDEATNNTASIKSVKEATWKNEAEKEQAIKAVEETISKYEKSTKEGMQAFKDSTYDFELAKALKAYNESKYQAAVSVAQTTPGAYLGYAMTNTLNLASTAGSALFNMSASIGGSLLRKDRLASTTINANATTATTSTFLPSTATTGGGAAATAVVNTNTTNAQQNDKKVISQ